MLKWRKDDEWAEDGILSMLAVLHKKKIYSVLQIVTELCKQAQVNFYRIKLLCFAVIKQKRRKATIPNTCSMNHNTSIYWIFDCACLFPFAII